MTYCFIMLKGALGNFVKGQYEVKHTTCSNVNLKTYTEDIDAKCSGHNNGSLFYNVHVL